MLDVGIITKEQYEMLSASARNEYWSFISGLRYEAEVLFDFLPTMHPVETFLVYEYGTNYYYNFCSCDMKCFAKLWKDFTPYTKKRSLEIYREGIKNFGDLFYSFWGNVPIIGAPFNIVNIKKSDDNDSKLSIELLRLRVGPKIINEEYFRKLFKHSTDYYIVQ